MFVLWPAVSLPARQLRLHHTLQWDLPATPFVSSYCNLLLYLCRSLNTQISLTIVSLSIRLNSKDPQQLYLYLAWLWQVSFWKIILWLSLMEYPCMWVASIKTQENHDLEPPQSSTKQYSPPDRLQTRWTVSSWKPPGPPEAPSWPNRGLKSFFLTKIFQGL